MSKQGLSMDNSTKYIQDCYELLYDLEIIASKYQYSVQFLGKSKDYYSIILCQNRRASNDLLHNLNQKMEQISECFNDARIRPLLRQGKKLLNERMKQLVKRYKM